VLASCHREASHETAARARRSLRARKLLSAVLGIPAALLLAATGVGEADAASLAGLEGDELVAMAATMVRMADRDRRWLRERFAELRELLVLRRASSSKGRAKRS